LVFRSKKWNWKRVAANLLLVPVLTGGTVAFVHAQFGKNKAVMPTTSASATAPVTRGAAPAATGDPKQLLKDGRKALEEGRFADARDLAMAAEANNQSGKWGLFDDTPAALRKDIQAAQAKANKVQSEQLVKQAKSLATKPAKDDGERAYNLDTALQMARKADQLHGPYSAWDGGDRADKLVKELESARAKIKVAATTPPRPANTGTAIGTQPGTPFANTLPPAGATADAKKTGAMKLMSEGRALADQGNFAAAKAKFVEADKMGANFSAQEYNPGFALQELNARGTAAIDKLIRDAQAFSAQQDFVKANASLTNASTIATTLGLFPKPVNEAKSALYVASSGKFGTAPPSGIAATGGTEYLVPASPIGGTTPAVPPGTQTVYGKPDTPAGNATGRQLLDQAAYEFKKGEFETASKLALQAHNLGGVQDEARALLNSIDTERWQQKQRVAMASLESAKSSMKNKDYQHSMGVLVLIEPNFLTKEAKAEREQLLTACKAELDKTGTNTGVVTTGGTQLPGMNPLSPDTTPGATNPPGTARVAPDSPTSQADALRKVQFQKLRSEGLKVQTDAQAAFGRGETDLAMQLLVDYSNRVRASGLDSPSIAMLLRPVDGRLDTFRLMKGQTDAQVRLTKEKRDAKEQLVNRGAAEEQRKVEVANLVRRYHDLVKKNDYVMAERVALQAKQIDPDDVAVGALYDVAKLQRRVKEAEQDKADREKFFLYGMRDAEYMGPLVTASDPVAVQLRALNRSQLRGSGDNYHIRTRTPATYDIELKLEKPISVEFRDTPLNLAIENLQTVTGLPLWLDTRALQEERISEVQLTSFKLGTSLATKNVLACVLEPCGLSYVIENDVVKITTVKKAKGRLHTKVFSVADLVTPVPNFALPDYANFDKMLNRNPLNSGALMVQGLNLPGGNTPYTPPGSLGGGQTASMPGGLATTPGIQSGQGGTLQTSTLTPSSSVVNGTATKHEQLIKLITSMVRPYSWDGHGGSGKVEFFDIGSALVVNQTADVITEVADLLEALRRLQDLSVAVEVRIVSLSEAFYERMGMDFSVNIKTNTSKFEPALTSGVFRPAPFVNDINTTGQVIGLTPAGSFTPDLDVPIRATSFNRGIPFFGGFPNSPGNDGGISLGLAFLNDIQVYTLLEMAQGDRRINVMQAPKLTLFNGQTSTLSVSDLQFYVAGVQVISVNGQLVFIPQNTPFPSGGLNVNITIQAVVSADRRFVRLNLPVNFITSSSANIPLFPITTFITPVFEGGSQGQPIPFTQFIQQPGFTTTNVQTTVVCPDGGTVLLGGLKQLSEGRNEFGPPFLSKIPYLNRLFKNVGVGRESSHVMIMVTPRIIINAEEEIFQTEGRQPTGN
jgi:type II secretory pathway component GspD/PulD (secretin)